MSPRDDTRAAPARAKLVSYEWEWDPRRQSLVAIRDVSGDGTVHTMEPAPIVIPLGSGFTFRCWLSSIQAATAAELARAVEDLTRRPRGARWGSFAPGGEDPTLQALGVLGYRLLLAAEAARRPHRLRCFVHSASDTAPYREIAEKILRWMGPDSPLTSWRVFYDESLPFGRRFNLMETARSFLAGNSTPLGYAPVIANTSEQQRREAYWWTTRCQYELAIQWEVREGSRSPQARSVLRDAGRAYLSVLRDEPHSRALEAFLREGGRSIEDEVNRVLGFGVFAVASRWDREAQTELPSSDEALRRTFFSWYLKRYNLHGALYMLPPVKNFERAGATQFAVIALLVLVLIVVGWTNADVGAWLARGEYFGLQVAIQVASVVVFIVSAPTLSRIALPRAFFGTLLAWLTVIGGYALGITDAFRASLHNVMTSYGTWGAMAPSLALIAVAFTFMYNEVTSVILNRTLAAIRVAVNLVLVLAGGLFWGLIFARPLQMLFDAAAEPPVASADPCRLYLTLVGGCASVVFGILVQLLWDTRAITEPFGEPA